MNLRTWQRLWMDHIVWTRSVLVAILEEEPALSAYVARLLENADAMAAELAPVLGPDAAAELRILLRAHLTIAGDLVGALHHGDSHVGMMEAAWRRNGSAIVDFLEERGPVGPLRALWTEHLNDTLREAIAHHDARWSEEIAAWDRIYAGAMAMAEVFAGYEPTKREPRRGRRHAPARKEAQ